MSIRTKSRRDFILAVLPWLLLACWHIALRRHGFGLPLIRDEGEYAYEARVWRAGGLPYRDAFCQKPPMVFLLYRACLIFSDNPLAPRGLAIIFVLAAAAFLRALSPRSWTQGARWAAPAALATLATLPVGDYGFTANTEVFLCAFTALSALALFRAWEARGPSAIRWLLLSGASAGAAMATKQTAFWTALSFALLAGWQARGWKARRCAVFLAAATLIPLLWLLYFTLRGGLGPFLFDVIQGNVHYAAIEPLSDLPRHMKWFLMMPARLLAIGAWPAILLAAWGLQGIQASFEDRLGVLAVIWLASASVGAATGLFFFPHYFLQIAPPLALCAAFGAQKAGRFSGATALALAVLPVISYAGIYLSRPSPELARRLLYPSPLYEARAVAEIVASRTSPSDPVYVFGSEPQIYIYANRRCATPNIFAYPLTLLKAPPGAIDAELTALKARRPKIIVYIAQPISTLISSREGLRFREGVRAMLAQDYKTIGKVEIGPQRTEMFLGDPLPRGPWADEDVLYIFERLDHLRP